MIKRTYIQKTVFLGFMIFGLSLGAFTQTKTNVEAVHALYNGFTNTRQEPIIIDHTCIELDNIPGQYIDSAKANLWIGYGHTSHGKQLTTAGMNALEDYFTDGTYDWSNTGGPGELHLFEGSGDSPGYLAGDCGYLAWPDETREYLNDFPGCNVIIWAWCGQITNRDLPSHYFGPMEQLESEYPDVQFVFMTGHLEGSGVGGDLELANNQVRDYCIQNNKILFDFADIEKYTPDADTNFQVYYATDACDYNHPSGGTANWADDWVAANPDHELTQITNLCSDCAHSRNLNCTKKGIACWYLWARLAGWGTDHISTWDGSESDDDWTNDNNWSNEMPIDGKHAIIPGGLDHYPTIKSSDNAHVDFITIEDGGSLIGAEYLTVDDIASMERYFSPYSNSTDADGWHIIASPMLAMPITGTNFVPGSLDDLFIWDENDYYWRNYKVHNFSPFEVGKGYLHAVETAATKDFYGDFNITDLVFNDLSYTPTMGNGWHMLGNPFQSALLWNDGNWALNNVSVIAKILKNNGTGYKDLLEYDSIAANQGFFIKVLNTTNNITIPLSSRVHSGIAFQKSSTDIIKLKAVLEDERYISINIGLNNQATLGFDSKFDGYHMSFTGIADMYSKHGDDNLSTNYIPYPEDMISLPVYFIPYQERDYTMKIKNIEMVREEYEITLEDKQASQAIDLREMQGYAFSASPNDNPDRFIIHLRYATGIRDGLNGNNIAMYMTNRELNVLTEQPVHGQVDIINAMGQVIFHEELERKGINRYRLNMSPGVYMVRIMAPGVFHTGKVYVQ